MIYQLVVPQAVDEVTELRVLQWHAVPGQALQRGELLVELETHKAVVEVRAGQDSTLREITAAEGDWQKIGAPLAFFTDSVDEPLLPADAGATALVVDYEII